MFVNLYIGIIKEKIDAYVHRELVVKPLYDFQVSAARILDTSQTLLQTLPVASQDDPVNRLHFSPFPL